MRFGAYYVGVSDMKRDTTGERARKALRGHWAQAWAWEGAVLCGVLALMAVQGVAATIAGVPMAVLTPAFVLEHPVVLWIVVGGLLGDLLLLSPLRFGRATFYVRRAAAQLPFSLFEPESEPEPTSLLRSRHGKAVLKKMLAAVRRLWRAGRYRRIVAGRLLWWGWNLLGALLLLSTPAFAFWAASRLSPAAAPYPLYLTALAWLSTAIGAVLWAQWSLRLSPLTVLLAAHPSWSVSFAARRAWRSTRGRTFRLIRRTLGFFGWFFTCAAVIPIAYVQPMYATAQAGWLLSTEAETAKQKSSCKADLLYTRNKHKTRRRLIWPTIPAGRFQSRRPQAE